MEICNKGRLSAFDILEMLLSSYKPHIRLVDPQKAPRDREKKHVSP